MLAASDVCQRGFTMRPLIDAICGEICLRLVDIDEELRYLKITIRDKACHAAPEVRSRLEKVMQRIAYNPKLLRPGRRWNIGSRTRRRMPCFGMEKSSKTETAS